MSADSDQIRRTEAARGSGRPLRELLRSTIFTLPFSPAHGTAPSSRLGRSPEGNEAAYGLVERLPAVVFRVSLDGPNADHYVSSHAFQVLGLPSDGSHDGTATVCLYETIHREDRERWCDEVALLLTNDRALTSVYRIVARDGRVRSMLCSAHVVREGRGAPPSVHGVAVDMTEQQSAAEQFRTLFQTVAEAIVVCDAAGRIVLINDQAERLFQWERQNLVGMPVQVLIPEGGDDPHALHRAVVMDRPRQRDVGGGLEVRARRRDGSELDVEISLSPLETEHGRLVAAMVRDVTQRRLAERRLQDSLQEKEALLQEIHHRVKNNLAVIGGLFFLQSTHTTDEATLSILRDSRNRVRSMALVHEMLYSSRALSRVALADYAGALARQLMHAYEVTLGRVELVTDLQPIDVDIAQAIPFGLVLNEMMSNALKHAFRGDRHGRILLRVGDAPDGRVELVVRDDGYGLPQGLDTTSPSTLGLRLMQMLAQQLDGSLTLAPAQPGTEVRLVFRRAA